MLDMVCKEDMMPNVTSFSFAVSVCEQGEQWETALSLLGMRHEESITPNAITFNAAVSACEKGG